MTQPRFVSNVTATDLTGRRVRARRVPIDITMGSFVEGLPIAGLTPLADGARVQFGTVVLTFRTLDSEASTATGVGQ